MKTAILNISIGNYFRFWEKFYESSKANFLPDTEKTYFIFTDKPKSEIKDSPDIIYIYQENLGWPFNTMKRFAMFERIKDQLREFDYIFFINGNALFTEKLNIKFIKENKDLITVQHPGFYRKAISEVPFERNPESNAYIPVGNGKFYIQGAFIGGKAAPFLDMVSELNRLTEEDLSKNIVAVWHDESFINKYIVGRENVQVLGPQYLGYEEYVHPYKAPIILRNKRKNLDLNSFRNISKKENVSILKIKMFLRNLKERLLIILGIRKRLYWKSSDNSYIDNDVNS